MIKLADLQAGESIYDPCFGSGNLLFWAAGSAHSDGIQLSSISGIELDPMAYVVGMTRMVLRDPVNPLQSLHLELGDALDRPVGQRFPVEGFDCVLSILPFGRYPNPEAAGRFRVKSPLMETLFLQHIMDSLRPGGRAVVAVPDPVLFRMGADSRVREILLKEYRVEGVLSLPEKAINPITRIKSSILIFRRSKPGATVRFLTLKQNFATHEKEAQEAEDVVREFREGRPGRDLWETPVEKLESRGWALVARPFGEEKLGRLLLDLEEADKDLPVKPLGEIVEIFPGLSYTPEHTVSSIRPGSGVGLLRASDIKGGKVLPPALFLDEKAAEKAPDNHRLRYGDIVLTTRGAVGKIGVVPHNAVDAVPSRNLVVLRPRPGVMSRYLSALLRSESIQLWFAGRAQGSTVQSLPVDTLKKLMVPVPPLSLQNRVVTLWDRRRGDAVSHLRFLVTGKKVDAVGNWLETADEVQEIRLAGAGRGYENGLILLERFAQGFRDLRDKISRGIVAESDISNVQEWMTVVEPVVSLLRGITQVPEGSARAVVLQKAHRDLRRAEDWTSAAFDTPEPDKSIINLTAWVTYDLSAVIDAETEMILGHISIRTRLEPGWVVVDRDSEIVLSVKNDSPCPLRNFSVTTDPNFGENRTPYLAEEADLNVPLTIPAQPETGLREFSVSWEADRIDGKPVSGRIPLAVEIRSPRDAEGPEDLGASPYIVGTPIDRKEMFFGREGLVDRIRRQLSSAGHANVILLEGNRRTGKSSILKHLETEGVLPGWVVVNCSFQGGQGDESKPGLPTREVFRLMARKIGEALIREGVSAWLPDQPPPDPNRHLKFQLKEALSRAFDNEHPFEVFETFVASALKAVRPRRLLLMLDEFDKLQEGIDSGVTSPQTPENIRYLLHAYPGLSAILTGSLRLKRLREEYWSALFGLGYRMEIGELALKDARELVSRPVKGRLVFVPQARDRIVDLCARQPFLIQSLCNRIFEYAVKMNERTITLAAVKTSAKEMIHDNEHFRTLWGYAKTERRRLILALCQKFEKQQNIITIDLLDAKLEEMGVVIPRGETVGDDVESLRELELLKMDTRARSSVYRLAIPLMADWIHTHIDFDALRRSAVREGEETDI